MTVRRLNDCKVIKGWVSAAWRKSGSASRIKITITGDVLGTMSFSAWISAQAPDGSKGLRTLSPRPATSAALRVTSTKSCTLVVAARSASTTGTERMPKTRPQLSTTAASTPSMRGPNACTIACSHTLSARALSGSRIRTASTPSSDLTNGERTKEEVSILDAGHPVDPTHRASRWAGVCDQ